MDCLDYVNVIGIGIDSDRGENGTYPVLYLSGGQVVKDRSQSFSSAKEKKIKSDNTEKRIDDIISKLNRAIKEQEDR